MGMISTRINTFFSKIFFRNRLNDYSRDYYYEEILDKYSNGQFYKNLNEKLGNLSKKRTTVDIKVFENKNFDGVFMKNVFRQYGKSNYKVKNEDFPAICILFYKRRIGKYKVKMEFHFYNNKLFFVSYNFPYVSDESYYEVVRVITDKYLEDSCRDLSDIYIIDRNNNIILPDNVFGFSVYYFRPDGNTFNSVLKYMDALIAKNRLRGEMSRKVLYDRL